MLRYYCVVISAHAKIISQLKQKFVTWHLYASNIMPTDFHIKYTFLLRHVHSRCFIRLCRLSLLCVCVQEWRLGMSVTLQETLCVVVEFWAQEHSPLNSSLVEKGFKDLAEHMAILCQGI